MWNWVNNFVFVLDLWDGDTDESNLHTCVLVSLKGDLNKKNKTKRINEVYKMKKMTLKKLAMMRWWRFNEDLKRCLTWKKLWIIHQWITDNEMNHKLS